MSQLEFNGFFRILATFYFKLYIHLSKNLCVTCPSSEKYAHWAKRNGHMSANG